ncbi:hypothetical protein LTR95_000188 [Oleoguttula sp. CCFEE 5521]
MGRLATVIAAAGADAINIPPVRELPRISLLDALMPKSLSDLGKAVKAAKPHVKEKIRPRAPVTYYEVKKNRNGSRSLVAHRGAMSDPVDRKASNNHVKKDNSGGQKVGGNDDKGKTNTAEGNKDTNHGDKSGDVTWTAEEDEKLKAMKAENKSWRDIATELHKGQKHLKERHKQLVPEDYAQDGKRKAHENADKSGTQAGKQDDNKKNSEQNNAGKGKQGKKNKSTDDNNAKQDKKQNNQKSQPPKMGCRRCPLHNGRLADPPGRRPLQLRRAAVSQRDRSQRSRDELAAHSSTLLRHHWATSAR